MEVWMVAVIAAIVALAMVAVMTFRKKAQHRDTERLQRKFGREYQSAVGDAGRKKGEADLVNRVDRVEGFDLRPLVASEGERFTRLWAATQGRFVDDPGGAISDADHLLSEAMQARGYPVSDFEHRAQDLSVNHPEFVANYRAAHAEAVKHSHGESSTESLRQAMVNYRWLFTDLIATDQASAAQPVAV